MNRRVPRFILAGVFISIIAVLGLLLALRGGEEGAVEAADAFGYILVSNMGHGGTLLSTQTAYDYAQAFQTGSNPNGYTLDNIQIVFTHATSTERRNIMNPRIELHRVDSSGHWQPVAAWLDPDLARRIPEESSSTRTTPHPVWTSSHPTRSITSRLREAPACHSA